MATINYRYYEGDDIYNDGNIESELLNYYKNDSDLDFSRDDIFFHTTCIRKNIINWYPFKKNTRVLEIGAGTGAVTGALLETGNYVVAVEESKRRSEVIYERYKECDNLEVYCGNFNEMEFGKKFDYVVLVGVFEYSKKFCNGKNPYKVFLKNIKKCLAPNGRILIAIENKIGLKYFNGLSEDHYREPYVGIEGYQDKSSIKTFGRQELKDLLAQCGLHAKFYGVFPDYKMPSYIFSEDYFPEVEDAEKITQYNYENDYINFDIKKVAQSLIKNGLLLEFSNSFFVEASRIDDFAEVDFVTYQNYRNEKYLIGTSVGREIVKFPVGKGSIAHLDELLRVHKILNEHGIRSCKVFKKDGKYYNEKIKGKTLLSILREYVKNGRDDLVVDELKRVLSYFDSVAIEHEAKNLFKPEIAEICGCRFKMLPVSLLDLHAGNIFKSDDGGYILIDQEWSTEKELPIGFYAAKLESMLFTQIPEMAKYYKDPSYLHQKTGCILEKREAGLFDLINNEFFYNDKKWYDNLVGERLKEKCAGASVIELKKNSELVSELKARLNKTEEELATKTQTVQNYYLENKRLKEKGFSDYKLLEFYKNELSSLSSEFYNYRIECEKKNQVLSYELENYKGGFIRLAKKIQNICARIVPVGGGLRRIMRRSYNCLKKILRFFKRIVMATFYRLPPKKTIRRRIYYKVHRSKKLSRLLHEFRFDQMPTRNCILDGQERVLLNNPYSNSKIAAHLHLYYIDLLDEFYEYLSHIPYRFDLYVSVADKKNIGKVKRKLGKLFFVDKVTVREAKNCGRDFGPMFVIFGNELKKYDYLLHIHSKKSLRTGSEQASWRHYLLDNLLGSNEMVMQYFDLMERYGVGIAYPDSGNDVAYWCHVWLQSRGKAEEYFGRFGLRVEDEYLDFSVGSMFWCKVDAIRQLFDLNLTWEDFGKEEGADEGTLAHAIERGVGAVAKFNKYSYATLGRYDGKFHINYDAKNLEEYAFRNKEIDKSILLNYQAVTFDIFDTLVTRVTYEPDDVFRIVDKKVCLRYGFTDGKFLKLRKRAEEELRKEKDYIGDVNIHEIYGRFARLAKISMGEAEEIKRLEVETDINTMIPRKDVLEIYNELLGCGKKIILITDMYYTEDIIKRILDKCGYDNYYDLLISSEVNRRKSDGSLWQYYWQKYPTLNSIHVGDNEASDIHILVKAGKPALHILQGRKLYALSRSTVGVRNDINERIAQGLIINKHLANSPFVITNDLKIRIESLETYGYVVFGPILFYFLRWLIKNVEEGSTLLFVSREGYFLQRLFHDVLRHVKKEVKFNDKYFLISRRAISVPTIENENDIRELLNISYRGTLQELIETRFGLVLLDYPNFFVELPRDIPKVIEFLRPNFYKIFEKAKQEKNNYKKYINKNGGLNEQRIYVVDIGYSGTAQYYLSKMLCRKIDGAYMIVENNLRPLSINHNEVKACLNETIYADDFGRYGFGRHTMLLEAFLTSGCGQLQSFDDNGEPLFANTGSNNVDSLERIYNGVREFINDIARYCDEDILDVDLAQEFVDANYEKNLYGSEFSDEIKRLFKVEDLYTSNGDIVVF